MKSYYIFLVICLLPVYNFACSCINAGDFCTIFPNAIEQGNLVVQGSPGRIIGHGMEFNIDVVVSGTETRKRIMVWGDPGYLCRTYVTGFRRSDRLLLILDRITQDRTEFVTDETEKAGDYSLSVCGQFFVFLNGPNAADIDCFSPAPDKPSIISAFPNPTKNSFNLFTDEPLEMADILQVNVFQANGQLLYKKGQLAILEKDESIEIETSGWLNGVYFVEIRTLQERWLTKLVVMK